MDTFTQHVTELKVYGYTIVHDVLSKAEVVELRDFVVSQEEKLGVVTHHLGEARHLANLVNLDPMFFKTIDHERVLPLIEAIMGENLILGSLNARVVRPGDGNQTLHSDVPIELHRYGEDAPVMMNTVWPLHDYTLENGATRLVPGSHQSHLSAPPEGFEVKHELQAIVPAGSVVILNGQLWHAGGANRTGEKRAAMFGHYRFGDWMRFQCDPHDQFPEAWWELLSLRQKQLLRMTQGVTGKHGADFYER